MQLWPAQREVLTPLRTRFIHGDAAGSGKTPVGLSWLAEHGSSHPLIVVPSDKIATQWIARGREWYPDLELRQYKGAPAVRHHLAEVTRKSEVGLVVTYGTIRNDAEVLCKWKPDALILDESHHTKTYNSINHKQTVKIARRVELLDVASASPLTNGAEETWALLHLLYPSEYTSFWRFAHEHFYVTQEYFAGPHMRPTQVVGDPRPGALDAIAAKLGPNLIQRSLRECVEGLPPEPQHTFYEVELSPDEREAYDHMLKHYWVRGDAVVRASNKLAQMTRLRQIASSWEQVMGDVGAGTKARAAVKLAKKIGEPMVFLTAFKPSAHAATLALNRAGIRAITYTGDDSDAQREKAIADFGTGRADILVGTYGVLREGVDGLQYRSHHLGVLDEEWTPSLNDQAVGREDRVGQKHQVQVHHIVALNTMDCIVAEACDKKFAVHEVVLGRSFEDIVHGNMEWLA